jgi:STE24 endopeptidase
LLGVIAGFGLGYIAVRSVQSAAVLAGTKPSASHDAAAYGRTQRALALTGTLRGTAAAFAFAYGPPAARFEKTLSPLPAWLRPGAFFAALSLASAVVDAPVALIEDHVLEQKYGLSEQPLRSFALDYVKSAGIGAIVAGGLAILGGAILGKYRRWWPLLASATTLPLYVLANIVVPVFIMPLFNTFEPLEGPLETRLRALAARFGVGDADILRMNMSKQTKKANAFVAGVGSTHRIVLGDTLIGEFQPDEVEFVVAHELGHYVTHDTWRLVGLAQAVTMLLLASTALAVRDDGSGRSVLLARITAWLGAGMFVARPAVSAFSRSREWAADRFAVGTTGNAQSGARAFARLRDQNLAENDLPGWYEFLFATHPSLGKRIEALHGTSGREHGGVPRTEPRR